MQLHYIICQELSQCSRMASCECKTRCKPRCGDERRGAVPKRVDHQARRLAIAEAIFAVIGSRGLEAVSLRDVAAQAGVSMGAVQHYFDSKEEMLLFALGHMRDRALARMHAELAAIGEPTARETTKAAARAMLPIGEQGRQEAIVAGAFYSVATVHPAYAGPLREGYQRLLAVSRQSLAAAAQAGELPASVDTEREAAMLFFLIQGLVGPVLIGILSPAEALELLDHQLDRIFAA